MEGHVGKTEFHGGVGGGVAYFILWQNKVMEERGQPATFTSEGFRWVQRRP